MDESLYAIGISHSGDPIVEFVGHNGYTTIADMASARFYTREEAQAELRYGIITGFLWPARTALICIALQSMGSTNLGHSAHQRLEAIRKVDAFLASRPHLRLHQE